MKPNSYILITRLNGLSEDSVQTLGESVAVVNHSEVLRFKTLELPWKQNQQMVSCIPLGEYEVVRRSSNKFKNHFHILNVPNRSLILMHPANYSRQLLGCIAPGEKFTDIDGDGLRDVTSSRPTLDKLLMLMPEKFTLYITHANNKIGDLDPKTEKRV